MPQLITGNTVTTIDITSTIHQIVTQSATVSGTAAGIQFGAGSDPGTLTVAGTVASGTSSGHDGIALNGNDHVTISQTGVVAGTDEGILISGTGNSVVVSGYVFGGDNGIYALLVDSEVTITDTGVVKGAPTGRAQTPLFPSPLRSR